MDDEIPDIGDFIIHCRETRSAPVVQLAAQVSITGMFATSAAVRESGPTAGSEQRADLPGHLAWAVGDLSEQFGQQPSVANPLTALHTPQDSAARRPAALDRHRDDADRLPRTRAVAEIEDRVLDSCPRR